MSKKTWGIVTLCTLGSAGLVWGAPPQRSIQNSVVQEISAAAGLRTEVQRLAKQRQDPFWIGYEVPLVSGIGGICSPSNSTGKLERDSEQVFQSRQGDRSPHPDLMVLLRVHQGEVSQIRSLTTDCSLDAGGLPLLWLRNVEPGDSVALLSSLVRPQASEEIADSAVFAIGAHADKTADEALKGFVRTGSPEVRQRALARLGNARGRAGFETLRDLLAGQENAEARKQVLLAIAWSQEPEAEDLLLQAAREDRDVAVRSWALVRYAGQSGSRALPVLTEAIAHDPHPEIRSAAVHALRRLPEGETREVLENLARQKADPEIRRQAQLMLDRMEGRRGPAARARAER
jgi:hypothetical protein